VRVQTEDDGLQQDAALLADELDVPVDEANGGLDYQLAVDEFVLSLPAEILANDYAGAEMVWDPEPGAVLYFKADVPEAVVTALSESGLTGVTLQGDVGLSNEELQAEADAAHDALLEMGFGDIVSGFDLRNQEVQLDVIQRPGRPDLTGQALRDAIIGSMNRGAAARGTAGRAPAITITEYPPTTPGLVAEQTAHGGAQLRDGTANECTSAFAVNTASNEGVLTAAHCDGLDRIVWHNTSGAVLGTHSLAFVSEHAGVYGDFEYRRTGYAVDDFWASTSALRDVSGTIANTSIDTKDTVCLYGRASARRDCGTVARTSIRATSDYSTYGDLVEVTGVAAQRGDSGGPWSLGNTAWGIHSGRLTSNNNPFFSKIRNAEAVLGVRVQR
jgi:hypothetical protein